MWSRDARARLLLVVAVAFICFMPSSASNAGGAMPSCVSKLAPCLNATDTTPLPDSCCDPLKEAACVCAILMNKAAPEQGQGVLLAKRCGVTTDASTCAKYADAAASGTTAASLASTGTAASTAQTTQLVDSSKMAMCICPKIDPPCSKDGCFCCYDGPGWPCFQTREQCKTAKVCGCDKRSP